MQTFAQDLYTSPQSTNNSPETRGGLAFSLPENIDLNFLVSYFNYFALLWTIFISFLFISNFYFYFRLFSDRMLERQSMGVKSLWLALHTWWRYIICVLFFVGLNFTSGLIATGLAVITLLLFGIKFWVDLRDLVGLSDYFDWYNNLTKPILNFLNLKLNLKINWLGKKK